MPQFPIQGANAMQNSPPEKMLRKVLLLSAIAVPLVLGIQKTASAQSATLITQPASANPIKIGEIDYNVFFNQDSDGLTTFNDVFGSGTPSLTFTDIDEADEAALAIVLSSIDASEFAPGFDVFNEEALIPWAASNASSESPGGFFFSGVAGNLNSPKVTFNGLRGRDFQFGEGSGFITFEEATPVPTPALLPGLVGLGFSAIRKRKLAQSEEA